MNVLLTSCGLETTVIENAFKDMLTRPAAEVKAMFIPTAANSPDAIEVLPKCLNGLLKIGIQRRNIFVYDLYDELDGDICSVCDVIYLCGGDPVYLLKRINERGFDLQLADFIKRGGAVIGVSAGSMIFADDMTGNLGLLKCALEVHCPDNDCEKPGRFPADRSERIRLGNSQAVAFEGEDILIIG